MKVVILAGGRGTRIRELSHEKPKPMIEIAGKPLIVHVMQIYKDFGITDFIVCGGYKFEVIQDHFKLDPKNRDSQINVTVVDTGLETQTAGRIRRVMRYLQDESNFGITYGDGIANIDISKLIMEHRANNNIVTLTASKPQLKYGKLIIDKHGSVAAFEEKPTSQDWINSGFMIADQSIFQYISDDCDIFEKDVLPELAQKGKVGAYKHPGYFYAMDTFKDYLELQEIFESKESK